jgi:hypothetical protein
LLPKVTKTLGEAGGPVALALRDIKFARIVRHPGLSAGMKVVVSYSKSALGAAMPSGIIAYRADAPSEVLPLPT